MLFVCFTRSLFLLLIVYLVILWESIDLRVLKVVVLMNCFVSLVVFRFERALKVVVCLSYCFINCRNLSLLFRLDLTRLISSLFFTILETSSLDKYERKRMTVQLRKSVLYAQSLEWRRNNLLDSTTSKKCIDQDAHVQIVSLRESVLFSQKSHQYRFEKAYWVCYNKNLMSNSIASRERTVQIRLEVT